MLAINMCYLYLLRRLMLRPRELTLGGVTRVVNAIVVNNQANPS
jgi:hypothetical protein